jgi:polysaccharide deacetylase family protein (PEP-CTERM system associated)
VPGTFFTLGWVARRFPLLVRRISGAGHEVASHGFWHRRIPTLTHQQFREDVRQAKQALEDACGEAVIGFRAPTFSILPGLEWAFDVLLEEGYRYDSSLFPIWRPGGYGMPGAHCPPYYRAGRWRPPGAAAVTPSTQSANSCGRWRYLRQLPFGLIRRPFVPMPSAAVGTFYDAPWRSI